MKEEIIKSICIKWGLNTLTGNVLALEVWNAAIDMAAENVVAEFDEGGYLGIEKESITDLKFKI